jgi:elongation factor Ts
METSLVGLHKHGAIKTYVHPGGQICAMVEAGCETDFVAKTEEFQNFIKEMALQVASMRPLFIDRSDISFEQEAQEMSSKMEGLRCDGYDGKSLNAALFAKMEQWFSEVCLLEQTYVRDSKKVVKEVLAELMLKVQENCKIRRFERWEVGEKSKKLSEVPEKLEVSLLSKMKLPATVILTTIFLITLFSFFVK